MKNWSWKAIAGGLIVDTCGGMLLGVLLIVPIVFQSAANGNLNPTFQPSPPILVIMALMGLFMDFLGGYLTALWAPQRKIAHSAIMGLGSVLVGALLHTTDHSNYPSWFILTWILVIPCAVLGGWLRVRTHGPVTVPKAKPNPEAGTPPIASPFGD